MHSRDISLGRVVRLNYTYRYEKTTMEGTSKKTSGLEVIGVVSGRTERGITFNAQDYFYTPDSQKTIKAITGHSPSQIQLHIEHQDITEVIPLTSL